MSQKLTSSTTGELLKLPNLSDIPKFTEFNLTFNHYFFFTGTDETLNTLMFAETSKTIRELFGLWEHYHGNTLIQLDPDFFQVGYGPNYLIGFFMDNQELFLHCKVHDRAMKKFMKTLAKLIYQYPGIVIHKSDSISRSIVAVKYHKEHGKYAINIIV